MDDVDAGTRVYRVTVRGRFRQLTDRARRYLAAAQPEHDIFVSAYTPEGTFTYDERIQFFNFRYEVRTDGTAGADDAELHGLVEAEEFLRTMGFGHTGLRATSSDLTAMWDGAR